MLLHPQATSRDHGGPRTSDLSIERQRRNQSREELSKTANRMSQLVGNWSYLKSAESKKDPQKS